MRRKGLVNAKIDGIGESCYNKTNLEGWRSSALLPVMKKERCGVLEKMENPLISIIIPAYNAEEYLPTTLDSILAQQVPFLLEIIVVNDGSTDGTLDVLQKYKEKYQNFTVITTENGGPANARNVGIQAALGEYLMFVDGDDTLAPDALGELGAALQEHAVDLLIFGFRIINQQTQKEFSYKFAPVYMDSKESLGEYLVALYQKNMLNQIWNKVYRRTLIVDRQISFMPFHYGEDRLFVFDVLRQVRNICVLDQEYYHYFMRDNDSLVSKYCADKFQVCCLIDARVTELAQQLEALQAEDMQALNYMYIKSVISCATNLHGRTCPLNHAQKRKALREMLEHPRVVQALSELPAQSNRKFLLLAKVFSWRNVTLTYFVTFWATKVMKWAPTAFMKAKHAENLSE